MAKKEISAEAAKFNAGEFYLYKMRLLTRLAVEAAEGNQAAEDAFERMVDSFKEEESQKSAAKAQG